MSKRKKMWLTIIISLVTGVVNIFIVKWNVGKPASMNWVIFCISGASFFIGCLVTDFLNDWGKVNKAVKSIKKER